MRQALEISVPISRTTAVETPDERYKRLDDDIFDFELTQTSQFQHVAVVVSRLISVILLLAFLLFVRFGGHLWQQIR